MTCIEIQEKLTVYIDGLLTAKEMSQIREHLLLCPECNREYLLLTEITELLGSVELPPLPKSFDAELRQRLEREKENPVTDLEWKSKKYKSIAAVAACFLICLVSVTTVLLHEKNLDKENISDMGTDFVAKSVPDAVSMGAVGINDTAKPADVQPDDSLGQRKTHDNQNDNSQIGEGADLNEGDISSEKNETSPESGDSKSLGQEQFSAGSTAPASANGGGTPQTQQPDVLSSSEAAQIPKNSDGTASQKLDASLYGRSGKIVTSNSGEISVMEAAYNAGAQTYNEALDFVSLIADNNTEGLIDWIILHSSESITKDKASELATAYMEKYKTNSN